MKLLLRARMNGGPRATPMARRRTFAALKMIEYCAARGVDCTIVDEHSSLLICLGAEGERHEFRYGGAIYSGPDIPGKFLLLLEGEFLKLQARISAVREENGRLEICGGSGCGQGAAART